MGLIGVIGFRSATSGALIISRLWFTSRIQASRGLIWLADGFVLVFGASEGT